LSFFHLNFTGRSAQCFFSRPNDFDTVSFSISFFSFSLRPQKIESTTFSVSVAASRSFSLTGNSPRLARKLFLACTSFFSLERPRVNKNSPVRTSQLVALLSPPCLSFLYFQFSTSKFKAFMLARAAALPIFSFRLEFSPFVFLSFFDPPS